MSSLRKRPDDGRRTPALRRLSQNFLVDEGIAERIVASFAPADKDHVLEVGPGRAQLTQRIIGRVERLVVVELDRRLAARLRERFPELDVRQDDILNVPLAELRSGPPVRVLANLPYGISSPFLVALSEQTSEIADATILLQLEFADRLAAAPRTKAYSSLTVLAQTSFTVEPLMRVPPSAFRPRPTVQSRLVHLVPRADAPAAAVRLPLRQLLRAAFSARRKTLGKGLAHGLGLDREQVAEALSEVGIDPRGRAEEVPPAAWVALATAGALTDDTV